MSKAMSKMSTIDLNLITLHVVYILGTVQCTNICTSAQHRKMNVQEYERMRMVWLGVNKVHVGQY